MHLIGTRRVAVVLGCRVRKIQLSQINLPLTVAEVTPMAAGLDSTKTADRPSHEAVESTGGEAVDSTPAQRLDHEAMESARRAQNRIHDDETRNPGTSIFTK